VSLLARIVVAVGCLVGIASAGSPGRCTVTFGPDVDLPGAVARVLRRGRPARICLGAGEFRLGRFLLIDHDHVTLRGVGAETVLRLDDGVESPVVVVGDWAHRIPDHVTSDVTIERLRVVGGGAGGGESLPGHPYLMNSAVVVRAGRRIVLRGLDVSGCRSACLLTEHGTRDVAMEDNRLRGSVWDGISLNSTARARLVGNDVRGNTAAGITAEHLEASVLARNVVADNRTHGIYLSDSHHNTVVDNRFEDNVLAGVFLTCAVHGEAPRVACWPHSMSAGNVFARNEFARNRRGFTIAPSRTAPCTGARFAPNRSVGDRFVGNPGIEPGPPAFGRCLHLVRGAQRGGRRASRNHAR
jgi:parallel beta-helix repeat protein